MRKYRPAIFKCQGIEHGLAKQQKCSRWLADEIFSQNVHDGILVTVIQEIGCIVIGRHYEGSRNSFIFRTFMQKGHPDNVFLAQIYDTLVGPRLVSHSLSENQCV